MSSTNKTTNYELSQFLGSDKPAWLQDYNSDMNKIDAQMKLNADAATAASGSANTANTAIGTLANLTTDVKTDLVNAINEVDGNADTAQGTANNASNTANSAKTTADGIATFLNMNTFATSTITSSDSATISGTVRNASNTDGSLGKIYGSFIITPANAPTITITTNLRPSESITIQDLAILQDAGGNKEIYTKNVNIATNGNATIEIQSFFNARQVKVILPPCLIFAQNFGD